MIEMIYAIEGLEDFDLNNLDIRRKAAQAMNRAARDARVEGARRILQQVNLPASYVQPGQGRFTVGAPASAGNLQTSIKARQRPTSLARFARSGRAGDQGGVSVSVKPGRVAFLRRAFLLPLRRGNTDTLGNMGLAIRLRPGETIASKRFSVRPGPRGLYLLYGPSVSQIFLSNAGEGVAKDISPGILDKMEDELLRLIGI